MSQYAPCHVSLNVRIKVKKKKHNITPRIVSLGRLCPAGLTQERKLYLHREIR